GTDDQLQERVILTYRPNQVDLAKFGRAAVRSDQYRLTIERGNVSLFDMAADPSQSTDVIDRHPDVAERIESQIRDYVREITPGIVNRPPVPITQQRPVFIPSVDAELTGDLGFADGISWAHGWVDQWQSKDDTVAWQVEFAKAGRYEIKLHYVCDSKNVSVETHVGASSQQSSLKRFRSTPQIRPDLDSKSTPRRMQSFAMQTIGVFDVPAGPTTITLKRLNTSERMLETSGITVTSADLPDDKSEFHLFLLAGQSNMAGRGNVTPIDRYPDQRIVMLDQESRWVPATDPVHFDKSVAGVGLCRQFAREYAAKHPGVTVGLVPCAVGGSPIAAWAPGGYHASTKTHPYDDATERITTAKEHGMFR
ncbi:MAG: sialate O-acetylesterase, partial [Planctomycetota bacterium]